MGNIKNALERDSQRLNQSLGHLTPRVLNSELTLSIDSAYNSGLDKKVGEEIEDLKKIRRKATVSDKKRERIENGSEIK